MGCCWSAEDDKTSQDGDVNERSRLLGNPAANSSSRPIASDEYGTQSTVDRKGGDEQSALSRILHQTANNVIDVSAIDSHSMEQHEYLDRAKQYSSRVSINSNDILGKAHRPSILDDVQAPDKILAADPVPISDVTLIRTASQECAKALKSINVEHKEDLVVQFGIP